MTTASTAPGRLGGRSDPIPGIDLADPDPARAPEIDRVLAGLRAEHPVFWHGPKSHPGFWAVIGYAGTMRVYRESGTFSATHGMTLDTLRDSKDPASGMMVEVTDPPEHRRLRRSIGAFFADGVVGDMTPAIEGYVGTLLTRARDGGGAVEFANAIAGRIPTYAAGLLLGLPAADLEWITARTAKVFLSGHSGSGGNLRDEAEQANSELLSYFARLLRVTRGDGGTGGLVQRLAAGTATRDSLSAGEVILNALNQIGRAHV